MNVVDTIREKVFHLPPKAQEEVLEIVEQIEERYHVSENPARSNGAHPLTLIADLAMDVGVTDFAERHDLYANGKLED
jgi:hypothetical protein